jgi:signal transduction histidine kinase
MASHTVSFTAMCQGDIDGALLDRLILDNLLLQRPEECSSVRLSVTEVPEMSLRLSIIARRSFSQVAERLNRRIGEARDDGTVARLALDHPGIAAASAGFVASLVQAQSRITALRLALIGTCILLAIMVLLLWRLRRDIKARRRVEAALRRAYHDLEQFAYVSHHDLREPLRNMTLFSQMLQRKGLTDPRAPEHLTYIVRGAERMADLLDAVRAYTQITDPAGPSRQITDVAEAVEAARIRLGPKIAQSGAIVETFNLPKVPFNRDHLVELFSNLIDNAIKYSDGGEPPRIQIGCETIDNDYRISVRDNGPGVPPEYHERIFGVFKRLHGREVSGTGIGLAICRKIVENHGGRIWVESEPGRGATFHFTVPRRTRRGIASLAAGKPLQRFA